MDNEALKYGHTRQSIEGDDTPSNASASKQRKAEDDPYFIDKKPREAAERAFKSLGESLKTDQMSEAEEHRRNPKGKTISDRIGNPFK